MRRSSLCCRDYCCWRVGLAGCAPCRQLKDSRISQTQHHPADKPILAWQAAARALVIRELLLQEARRLDIEAEPAVDSQGRRETDDEASIRYLMESEVSTPEPDEATCRRYYERHPAHFRSPALYEAAHILFAGTACTSSVSTARSRAADCLSHWWPIASPIICAKVSGVAPRRNTSRG